MTRSHSQAVCKRNDRYFVQIPLHPSNLVQALTGPGEVETTEDRNARVVKLLRGLLEGLYFLHQAGIVHRDLKGENVLVSEEGRAVLSDFETSKAEAPVSETVTRTVVSGWHTAPEVLKPGGEHSRYGPPYNPPYEPSLWTPL